MFGLLGSLVSAGINSGSQTATNKANQIITREQWARDDNAVQRGARDMLAAGINPLMAAGHAASNSAPIQMKAPQVGDLGAAMISDQQIKQQKELMDFNKKIGDAKLLNETNIANAQIAETLARTALSGEMLKQAEHNTGIAKERKGYIGESSQYDAIMRFFERAAPELGTALEDGLRSVSKSLAAGNPIFGGGITLFPPAAPKPARVQSARTGEVESEDRRRRAAPQELQSWQGKGIREE